MKIVKSNGKEEDVKFDKISSRIKKLTYGLDDNFVDSDRVSKKVIDGLYDGVTSRELDQLAAETAAGLTSVHPDYSLLASRLAITSFYKDTEKSFSKNIKAMYNYVDPNTGKKAGLINDVSYKIIMDNAAQLDSAIVHDRDFLLDYFGFRTLYNSYLLKDANGKRFERIQHMWMRVAVGIWGNDIEGGIKLYEGMSTKRYTHATPTLFNSATKIPQLSSCYLIENKGDSIDGIYQTLRDVALISKSAGGIGLHVHDVRAAGSYIRGTNGISNGLVPMLRVFNETARYVDQCFTKETKVLTETGYKSISDIDKGEKVLTTSGDFQDVVKNKSFDYDGPSVLIETNSGKDNVTPNHPYLVIKNVSHVSDENIRKGLGNGMFIAEWVDAKEISKEDIILSNNSFNGSIKH